MISNIEKGNGFRGCLDYNEKGTLIGGNMAGQNARELSEEFGAVRSLNQNCTRPVFHASLSAAPGEKLTDQEWNQAADSYMSKMGFTDNQYAVFRHTDTQNEHIHIVANRIRTNDLTVVHDSIDRYKSVEACREIEKEQGLKSGAKREDEDEGGGSGEGSGSGEGGGGSGYCAGLKRGINKSIKDCHGDKSQFVDACKKNGIDAKLNIQSTGRVAGVSYSQPGGKEIKGSDLGHGYKWQGVEKRIASEHQKNQNHGQKGHDIGKAGKDIAKAGKGMEKAVGKVLGKAIGGGPASVTKIVKKALEM